ncbi:hypothetical protein LPJ53_001909 [Coemansia erecta]|uniref:C2H2-type domain-containing protein n=1 Tax=Coemansia erecta TaxID=147472 RepID=A0A9W8CUE6_9FUNG|nr:hypothetical protein LPJ53_001909 [Coemansia erecta]
MSCGKSAASGFSAKASQEFVVRYTENEKLQRKYECAVCKKRFVRPSSLISHGYTHTGERPFACDFPGCSKKFSVMSNLRRHSVVHTRRRKSSGKDRGVKHCSGQMYGMLGTGAVGTVGLPAIGNLLHGSLPFSANSGHIQQLRYGEDRVAFGAMSDKPMFVDFSQQHGMCSANGSTANSAFSMLSQPLFGSSFTQENAAASSSFDQNMASSQTSLLMMQCKLPTPNSDASCYSSPESKWSLPQQQQQQQPYLGNPGAVTGFSAQSAVPTLPPPFTGTSTAFSSAHIDAIISNIPPHFEQSTRYSGSASSTSSDSSSDSALAPIVWPPSSAVENASADPGIQAALSGILSSNAQIATKPAVMTDNSLTTKAMNSAIELMSSTKAQLPLSPLAPFVHSSQQSTKKSGSRHQHSLPEAESASGPGFAPLPFSSSSIGQIGGMVMSVADPAAASSNGSSHGGSEFSIDSWLDNINSNSNKHSDAPGGPQIDDSLWNILRSGDSQLHGN